MGFAAAEAARLTLAQIAPSTLARYAGAFKDFAAFAMGSGLVSIREGVTEEMVVKYSCYLLTTRGVSPAYVKSQLAGCKSLLRMVDVEFPSDCTLVSGLVKGAKKLAPPVVHRGCVAPHMWFP